MVHSASKVNHCPVEVTQKPADLSGGSKPNLLWWWDPLHTQAVCRADFDEWLEDRWLISKWNPPFAVGLRKKPLYWCAIAQSEAALAWSAGGSDFNHIPDIWHYQPRSSQLVGSQTVYFKFWLSSESSWNSVINDRQHDAWLIITQQNHIIMHPLWLTIWQDLLKAHPMKASSDYGSASDRKSIAPLSAMGKW